MPLEPLVAHSKEEYIAWSMEIVLMGKVKKIILAQLSWSMNLILQYLCIFNAIQRHNLSSVMNCPVWISAHYKSNHLCQTQKAQEMKSFFFQLKNQLTFGEAPEPWQPR